MMRPLNKKTIWRYAATWLLILAFGIGELAHAAGTLTFQKSLDTPQARLTQILKDPALLKVPHQFARVQEIHQGTNGHLIIHVQDAHSNLSGQKHLAKTLEHMLPNHDLSLVLVEGATSDVTLTELKGIASTEVWKKVAYRFLTQGQISGEDLAAETARSKHG